MNEKDHYIVKTEVFEGPLDLLLSLIEKRKLLINDISLAKITDDYINFVKDENNAFSIKDRAQFILVASTLLLIKSKSILPTLDLTDEEQDSIHDLELRLKIYKRIKDTEVFVSEKFGKNISFFKQENRKNDRVVFAPNAQISSQNLFSLIAGVIKNLPKTEIRPKAVIQKIISLEEMIGNLTNRITKNLSMSFKEFSNFGKAEKVNIIVGFLAMLELVKQGAIEAKQEAKFGDINMQTNNFDTPKYF
jgi:segregation and condensation protein A